MSKIILLSVAIVPILIAVRTAKMKPRSRGLLVFLTLNLAFDLLFMWMLYVLRDDWVADLSIP